MAKSTVTPAPAPERGKITRQDLEDKFQSLQGDVNEVADQAQSVAIVVGAIVAVVVVLAVFGMGKRRGNKKMAFIEIRRV